ncbi:hypothetical protein KYC5002_13510 [Archangium violaceum]|uniref:hypothetical protein n=1 Tax=Archangium violaceum TaxID=83451 RepID=UPI002B2A5BE0|nr:hypothetical protein KYC5002_13510 [Archangium gephyra]
MKCKLCHAEISADVMKAASKGLAEPLCGTCRHELSIDPEKKGEYFSLHKGPGRAAAISRVGMLDKELAFDDKHGPSLRHAPNPFPAAGPGGPRPQIGFEIETTIRIRNSDITQQMSLDGKHLRTAFTWNEYVQAVSAPHSNKPYDGTNWALTIDMDPVTKLNHIEYVTKALEFTDAEHRSRLIRSLTDIAALSRYYYHYMVHKQGEAGSRMEHLETWIALMHAMNSKKQTAWLKERFANSTLDLSQFSPGRHAYMVEGLDVPKSYTWTRGRPELVHLSAQIRGSPQATVDIPIRLVFRFLVLMSRGSIRLSLKKEVPLFRQASQAEALRKIVEQANTLPVNEAQRGLIAMMAFYLKVSALHKTTVTFFKEAYPLLNRCGFGKWLMLVATGNFREVLPRYLEQVSEEAIDQSTRMITLPKKKETNITNQKHQPELSESAMNAQNPFRQAWVKSVITASQSKDGIQGEGLMLNTKHGWWAVKGDQLLTFEIRGMPQILVEEWRSQLVGIYDWFEAFLNRPELPEPAVAAAPVMRAEPVPVPVAQRPVPLVGLPALYYDLKDQERLDQQALDDIARLRQNHATTQHIEQYLRQRFS